MIEIWVPVINYEGLYEVSNLGRIKSLKFDKERVLKSGCNIRGYMIVVLSENKKLKTFSVHRLVWQSFNGGTDLDIDHINNIKSDNRLENLQPLSSSQNIIKYHLTQPKTSKYTGVSLLNDGRKKKWVAAKTINGKQVATYHYTEIDAHQDYIRLSEPLCR